MTQGEVTDAVVAGRELQLQCSFSSAAEKGGRRRACVGRGWPSVALNNASALDRFAARLRVLRPGCEHLWPAAAGAV